MAGAGYTCLPTEVHDHDDMISVHYTHANTHTQRSCMCTRAAKRSTEQLLTPATASSQKRQAKLVAFVYIGTYFMSCDARMRAESKRNTRLLVMRCTMRPVFCDVEAPDTCARTKDKTTQQNHVSCSAVFFFYWQHPAQRRRAKKIRVFYIQLECSSTLCMNLANAVCLHRQKRSFFVRWKILKVLALAHFFPLNFV